MILALTSAQARWLDQHAAACGLPGLVLMEAAAAKAAVVAAWLVARGSPAHRRGRVVVACGPGNNGGDGIALARHLASLGLEVRACLVEGPGQEARRPPEAAANLAAWRATVPAGEPGLAEALALPPDLVIDAMLGIGQDRPPAGPLAQAVELISRARRRGAGWPVLALDVPTGLDADTGASFQPCLAADYTVTFGAPKVGLLTGDGPALAGRVVVASIGLPGMRGQSEIEPGAGPGGAYLITAASAAPLLPPRPRQAHKGDSGRLLVVAGSVGMAGAASLCGWGALRGGAGLVTVAAPAAAQPAVAASRPELLTLPLSGSGPASSPAAALEESMVPEVLAAACPRTGPAPDAVAVGPGLGAAPGTLAAVRQLLEQLRLPVVLDADGINAWAGQPERLAARPGGTPLVLTPHPGELARLLGTTPAAVQADRLGHARLAARLAQAVCLLKGSGTVVAGPDGEAWIVPAGNAGMATAGMGDVLTGLIGAYLAAWARSGGATGRLVRLVSAAGLVHGLAGDLGALEVGTIGLDATAVAGRLPRARDLVTGAISPPPSLEAGLRGVMAFV